MVKVPKFGDVESPRNWFIPVKRVFTTPLRFSGRLLRSSENWPSRPLKNKHSCCRTVALDVCAVHWLPGFVQHECMCVLYIYIYKYEIYIHNYYRDIVLHSSLPKSHSGSIEEKWTWFGCWKRWGRFQEGSIEQITLVTST